MTGEMPDTVQITDNKLKVLKVDDAVNTTFVCEVKNRIGLGRDQVAVMVRGEFKDTDSNTCTKSNYITLHTQSSFNTYTSSCLENKL